MILQPLFLKRHASSLILAFGSFSLSTDLIGFPVPILGMNLYQDSGVLRPSSGLASRSFGTAGTVPAAPFPGGRPQKRQSHEDYLLNALIRAHKINSRKSRENPYH